MSDAKFYEPKIRVRHQPNISDPEFYTTHMQVPKGTALATFKGPSHEMLRLERPVRIPTPRTPPPTNPEPYALNPNPHTINSQPHTPNPKPYTANRNRC